MQAVASPPFCSSSLEWEGGHLHGVFRHLQSVAPWIPSSYAPAPEPIEVLLVFCTASMESSLANKKHFYQALIWVEAGGSHGSLSTQINAILKVMALTFGLTVTLKGMLSVSTSKT